MPHESTVDPEPFVDDQVMQNCRIDRDTSTRRMKSSVQLFSVGCSSQIKAAVAIHNEKLKIHP
jgi:hypothetical protein